MEDVNFLVDQQQKHHPSSSSPILIGRRLHQDALRSVVQGNPVQADVPSVHAGVRRGEAAGLGRRAGRQRLVGARDVGVGRSQRALTDRLVDVLHRLKHALPMASAQRQTGGLVFGIYNVHHFSFEFELSLGMLMIND